MIALRARGRNSRCCHFAPVSRCPFRVSPDWLKADDPDVPQNMEGGASVYAHVIGQRPRKWTFLKRTQPRIAYVLSVSKTSKIAAAVLENITVVLISSLESSSAVGIRARTAQRYVGFVQLS